MATLMDFYNLRYNMPGLRQRAAGAVLVAAWAVLNEGATETKRRAWAKTALSDAEGQALRVMPALIADSAIRAAELETPDSSTDASIQAVVNGMVDTLAGL